MGRIIIAILFLAGLAVSQFSGCAPRAGSDNAIVAKVNGYEITTDDLKEGALSEPEGIISKKAKDELLDRLITEAILIQEAQRENFDKDHAFMKEIERYWKQALMKLLIRKKAGELRDSAAIESWIDEARARADIKVYKENLKNIKLE